MFDRAKNSTIIAKEWIEKNKSVSDMAHRHLMKILQKGPVHPAGLGDFRKKYDIPQPLAAWLACFPEDFERFSMQESENEKPAVALVARKKDPDYWRCYRTAVLMEGELVPQASAPRPAESLAWEKLSLRGDEPGAIRAEIFRAFVLKNFGNGGEDMARACKAFQAVSGMKFKDFFGGMSAKEISLQEWGSRYCVWIPVSETLMHVAPVMATSANVFKPLRPSDRDALREMAARKIPERIDFEKLAADFKVTRESVLLEYVQALQYALVHVGAVKQEARGKAEGVSSQKKKENCVIAYFKRLFRAIFGRFGPSRTKYLEKWVSILLGNTAQDAKILLDDGTVKTGGLIGADDDYFTIKIGNETEIVERSRIVEVHGIGHKGPRGGATPDAERETTVGSTGTGTVKTWISDKGFGFVSDGTRMYYLERRMIDDAELIPALDIGKIYQAVNFVVESEADGKKYPRIRVVKWVNRAESAAGSRYYAMGRSALHAGDYGAAKTYFEKVLEDPGDGHFQSALKDLAELLNRTDANAAYALIERHRGNFDDDSVQLSFDKMEVPYLLRGKRFEEAEKKIDELLSRPDLTVNQREYYENQRNKIHNGTCVQTAKGQLGCEDYYIDYLMKTCDFHGLESKSIHCEADLPEEGDEKYEETMSDLYAAFKKGKEAINSGVPKIELKFYRNAEFSAEQLRLQLTDVCLLSALGNQESARISLRYYFWRKAMLLMFGKNTYSRREVLTHLIWTARLSAPATASGYWYSTLPILICYVVMGADREELRRIAEDEEYRTAMLGGFPFDVRVKAEIQTLVEMLELNKILPAFDEIFAKLGIPIKDGAQSYVIVREQAMIALRENSGLLTKSGILNLASFIDHMPNLLNDEDDRIRDAVEFLKQAAEYAGVLDFEKRGEIRDALQEKLQEYEQGYVGKDVTLTTTDIFYPYLNCIWDLVSENYAKASVQPVELKLSHAVTSQYYLTGDAVVLKLRLESVDPSRPSISDVSIGVVGDGAPTDDRAQTFFAGPLPGGRSKPLDVSVVPSPEAMREKRGVAKIRLTYKKEIEAGSLETHEFEIEYSIDDAKFEEIDNPYLRFERNPASGRYFVGREKKLQEITDVFAGDTGGQCYVLYGQRRSGKTSILNNLEATLCNGRYVYTKVSAGTWAADEMLKKFTLALEAKIENELSRNAVKPNAEQSDDYIGRLMYMSHYVKTALPNQEQSWVIGVDEFTYLFDHYCEDPAANREKVQGFLRVLKGLLEDKAFHLLLIGQESVVQMQKEFPNEFAVWRPHRLSYLKEDDVRKLADEPIMKMRDNGERESRYKDTAFHDLFFLTAGQPWFTQMFCSRMVSYLNDNRVAYVTNRVIGEICAQLCRGEDKIADEEFESFVNLMAPNVDEGKLVSLYYDIAANTKTEADWLPVGELSGDKAAMVPLLSERGLILVNDGKVRLRMGLFAEWLRCNPGRTRESFGGKI